jgi:type I restriction enzyme, S subunit
MSAESWSVSALGDVSHVEMGQSPPSEFVSDQPGNGIAFLQGNAEFTSEFPRPRLWCTRPAKLAKPGDILISVRAPVGAINRADRQYGIGRGLAAVRFTGVDPDFGYHALARFSAGLHRVSQGTTFDAIGGTELRRLTLPNYPRHEQRRIAEILDAADEAIRSTEKLISKLDRMKQGLLHHLLTRGIDKNGELRDSRVHPEQFKESMLGRIPSEWEVRRLGEVILSAVDGPFGSNLKTAHYVESPGVRVVRLQNIELDEFINDDKAYVTVSHAKSLQKHDVRAGDLLVASMGDDQHPIARGCVYPEYLGPGIVKADCFRLRADPSAAINGFISLLLSCPWTRSELQRLAQGVTRDRVNLGNLMEFRLALPRVDEQAAALKRVLSLKLRIAAERDALSKLRLVKLGLMEDLLTGHVRVSTLRSVGAA